MCYSLSICIFPLNEGTSLYRDTSKEALGPGVGVDGSRTAQRNITFYVSPQWAGRQGEVPTQSEIATFREGLNCRPLS